MKKREIENEVKKLKEKLGIMDGDIEEKEKVNDDLNR